MGYEINEINEIAPELLRGARCNGLVGWARGNE